MVPRLRKLAPPLALALATLLAAPQFALSETELQAAVARLSPEQQKLLREYQEARKSFDKRVDQYWHQVELKRKRRKVKAAHGKPIVAADYVKEQPPVYKGPKRPDAIYALLPKPPKPPVPVEPKPEVPVVRDFLAAAQSVYGFKPETVNEDDFMIAYAYEALKLGLSKEQVVRVYALETGGVGTHDLQSGYNPRTGRAASTALGYAQLLAANSIEHVRKDGPDFVERLERLAQQPNIPEEKAEALREKARALRLMIANARKVPESWGHHVAYAKTPNGFGMHALNLDCDIGPWMQVMKLRSILEYAAKKGTPKLTGAQLELMNLAGPGRGYEMMQPIAKDVPTSNFFDRGGYERNPVVNDRTGAQLLAKLDEIMERNVQKPGAVRFAKIFDSLGDYMRRNGGRPAVKASAEAFNPFGR